MEPVSDILVLSGRASVKDALIRRRKASFPLAFLSEVGIKKEDCPPKTHQKQYRIVYL